MLWNDEQMEKLRRGLWIQDCYEMILIQKRQDNPIKIVGPGYLKQNESGVIEYCIYCVRTENLEPDESLAWVGIAGELVSTERYYRLEAFTYEDMCWEAEATIPEIGGLQGGQFRRIVNGTVERMKAYTARPLATKRPHLWLAIFCEIRIPANSITETLKSRNGKIIRKRMIRNVATFTNTLGEFIISSDENKIEVELNSVDQFPPNIELRIVEALSFVLASPLYWNVCHLVDNNSEIVLIRGESTKRGPTMLAPVHGNLRGSNLTDDVWRLFGLYLITACQYQGGGYSPYSDCLFSILGSRAGSINTWALALSVGVERILTLLPSDRRHDLVHFRLKVKELEDYIKRWDAFSEPQTRDLLYKRVIGMVNSITDVNPKAKLRLLAEQEAIDEKHIKSWSDLRHSSAHGVVPASSEMQQLLDLCHAVTVLMYHLLFHAVGYRGPYVDYSTRGYPLKDYRPPESTKAQLSNE